MDSKVLGRVIESKIAKWGRGQNQVGGDQIYLAPDDVRAIDPLQIRPIPQYQAPQQSAHLPVNMDMERPSGQRGLRLAA